MPELKFYKSKWKALKVILLSLPFVIFSAWDLLSHQNSSHVWLDRIVICFFGLGIPIGLFNLLDGRPELIFDEEGIFDRASYGIFEKNPHKGFIKWDFITDAYLITYQGSYRGLPTSKQKYICLVLSKNAPVKTSKLSRSLGLADFNIPLIHLKNMDEHKVITFIKEMANADGIKKRELLKDYQL